MAQKIAMINKNTLTNMLKKPNSKVMLLNSRMMKLSKKSTQPHTLFGNSTRKTSNLTSKTFWMRTLLLTLSTKRLSNFHLKEYRDSSTISANTLTSTIPTSTKSLLRKLRLLLISNQEISIQKQFYHVLGILLVQLFNNSSKILTSTKNTWIKSASLSYINKNIQLITLLA